MYLSTSEAARELGVSDRQVRRAAANGRLVASRHGSAHSVSTRHVRMLARTKHRGRSWSVRAQRAALDLLSHGSTNVLASSELSRMKRRVRSAQVSTLAGQILRNRISLRRAADSDANQKFTPALLREVGLSADGGLGVLVAEDAARVARRERLGLDAMGDIAVVEGEESHRMVLEALTLFALGDTRESSAAHRWIEAAQARA